MSPLFTNTTCTLDAGSASWETIYKLLEDENLKIIKKWDAIANDSPPSNNIPWNDVANSFLPRIVVCPKILPYTDMVRCIVDHLDITDIMFITLKKTIIGSFKAKDLSKMYHLPQPYKKYDTQLIHTFMQENPNLAELIGEWRWYPHKHK